MVVDIPTKIVAEGLAHGGGAMAAVHGGVMLEAISANDL